jgi:hypothetical protein
MARIRDIHVNQYDDACDVCGRTLLRGEHPEHFLAGGERRTVCDLCTSRAQHEGWIREAGADDLALRPRHDGRGRSLLERLRALRRAPTAEGRWSGARELHAEAEAGAREAAEPHPTPAHGYEAEAPRRPRHVRAVPTNAELKMQRALEVFNASDHTRTVGGVARSLGPPAVCVRPLADRPSVVAIAVVWELSWYRYEVDLSDEAGGVRREGQGDEVGELTDEERRSNASADERGALRLGGP